MHSLDCSNVEWKFDAGQPETMSFEGYGAATGNVDAYGDVIAPGAFARYLADVKAGRTPWPLMLSQHGGAGLTADDMTPIGVWTHLSEDGQGLRVQGKLADTPRGREVYQLLTMEPRPALDGMSIGYIAKSWTPRSKPEEPKRLLTDVELVEISVVSRPANRLARIDGVKHIDQIETIRDCEEFLRTLGLSKNLSATLISKIKSAQRDARGEDEAGDPLVAELSAIIRRNIGALRT